MVLINPMPTGVVAFLSVLALSSRFDGPKALVDRPEVVRLSVLALSSRFDGPADAP